MRKKAFITGGSHGIGKGIATVLAKNGYDIAVTYNTRKEGAESLSKIVSEFGAKCFYYQASLEKNGVAREVTAKAIEDLGGIDLLVCNAGYTIFTDVLTLKDEEMDFLFNLNYKSYMNCAHVAANYMVDNKVQGNIIYISSTRGIRSYPDDCVYGGLKAALNRSVEAMALELAPHGIRVNSVAPGATATADNPTMELLTYFDWMKKIPLGRSGTATEVGELVHFLASDSAKYMTGNTVKIDGGLILSGMLEEFNEDEIKGFRELRKKLDGEA